MVVINLDKKEFDFKKLMQLILSSVALALVIFIIIWILDYFLIEFPNIILQNLKIFLNDNWFILVGFVLLKLIWDYIYGLYYKNKILNYTNPLIDSIELIFGFWLIIVFLSGLTVLSISEQLNVFLNFFSDLFFTQFLIIALLVLVVKYSQFFFYESKRIKD
ncbi:MAG: hypothetical protein PHO61_02645 [Candidatus ainarchaeum sp.]|jgi:hypothetical protein|nr:hypothetical protein [Candidatus ainarchaeum sp.]MDD4468137.1 hypothetical protein [Candidatus ainarchaeum sp.]HPM86280.1 hypothetical protein [archaeon]